MATNKNQMSIINEEDIKKALEAFKSSYKENKKQYEEKGIKVEDVVTLTEGFSGKNAPLVTIFIVSVMLAMHTIVIIGEKVKKGADNNIYN